MTHLRRIAGEQASQLLSIGVQLVDRLVLTGLLYRLWGAANFEAWSLCAALVGLVSLFELGFNMYFANRLMLEVETGQMAPAERTLGLSNTIFGACGLAGFAATAVILAISAIPATSQISSLEMKSAVLALATLTALRLSMCGTYGLYRAHRQFARFTLLQTVGDLARIIAVLAVVAFGGGLWGVSLTTLLAAGAVQCAFVAYDVQGRFGVKPFHFVVPAAADLREILPPSLAYFGQMIPLILLTHLPVLYVTGHSTATGLVSGFVLLRTLGGLPRALLQSLGVVLGQECARRLAVKDIAGATTTLATATRIFSALSGLLAGALFSAGPQIVSAWTGDAHVFRSDYFVAALLPMLVAAASVLSHNVLSANNTPYLAAVGRTTQLALSVLVVNAAPVADPGLRTILALSLGEVFGFTPLAYWAVWRQMPRAGVGFHLRMLALTLIAAGLAAMITHWSLEVVGAQGIAGLLMSMMIAAPPCGALFVGLGLPTALRVQVLRRTLALGSGRLAMRPPGHGEVP